MSTHAEATSVSHEIVVAAPVERAFRVFTEQLDRIKPREHNLLSADIETTVLEPRAGGRIYDRGVDGSECEWATVLAYEPPTRFVYATRCCPSRSGRSRGRGAMPNFVLPSGRTDPARTRKLTTKRQQRASPKTWGA